MIICLLTLLLFVVIYFFCTCFVLPWFSGLRSTLSCFVHIIMIPRPIEPMYLELLIRSVIWRFTPKNALIGMTVDDPVYGTV